MTKWSALFWAVSASVALAAFGAPSAQALTMKECSAKYKAAQQAGSLNGMSWTDFRKAECSSAATAATPAAGSKTAPAATSGTAASPAPASATHAAPATAEKGTRTPTGNAVFPTAVSSKYSGLSPAKARMQTCLDQYKANKANNANGGLTWIQKGGGYYSECNKRLKG